MKTMKKQTMAAFLMMVLGLFGPGLTDLRAQGQQEGIKVHGHWTIDVRQPDGTLVTHREFDNDLFSLGQGLLSQFLGRAAVPGRWAVLLWNSNLYASPQWSYCGLNAGVNNAIDFQNCTDIYMIAGILEPSLQLAVNNGTLVLSGAATALSQTSVAAVSTVLNQCGPSVSPAVCPVGGPQQHDLGTAFTGTTLPQAGAIPVVAGQIIQVTVVISFS